MKIEYPFGENCMDYIIWENGIPNFENMEQYFDAMKESEHTAENKLALGEYCIISVCRQEPEETADVTTAPKTEKVTSETTAKKPVTTTEKYTQNDTHYPEISDIYYDDDFFEIFSYAEFDGDDVVVCRLSSPENGTFTIYKSDDNKNYNKIAAVNDTKSYKYGKADFKKVYFKVKLEYNGQKSESGAIVVEKENGQWGFMYCDSDEDGIADYLEEFLGTDINKKDTDNDGLNDGERIFTHEFDFDHPVFDKFNTVDNPMKMAIEF